MRLNTSDFLRKAQHPLLLGLGSLPLSMLLTLSFSPETFRFAWCFPAAYVLLSWACLVIPGKKRVVAGVLSAILLVALCGLLLPMTKSFGLILMPLMYVVLMFLTLPIGGWPYNQELQMGWHVGGAVTHVLLQMLVNGSQLMQNGVYTPAETPVLCSFLAYAVLVLLALNRASLDSASQSRRKVPLLMKRQNILFTMVLLVIGVLLAAIPAIGAALDTVWDFILRGIALVMEFLALFMPASSGGGGGAGGGMGDMGFGEAAPPSDLALLLEKILTVLTVLIVVIALALLLRVLWKKLKAGLKLLWARMMQYGSAASEDYEDEITSTRDEEGTEREGLLSRLRRMNMGDEKGGTPTERVRMRYKKLKRRNEWSAASTARETLPDEAAALYERARYGGETLTEEEAGRFREGTRRV
jgi:hypothetical protein